MHVNYSDSKEFRTGHDVLNNEVLSGYHDFLEVKRAWKIAPPAESVAAYEKFRDTQSEENMKTTELRIDYSRAVDELLEPLDEDVNEVLLLHGTRPEVVAEILNKSLDPGMARKSGLFGAGTYFAEHPLKIDQYTTVDKGWAGASGRKHPLRNLHQKLYPTPDLHPKNVRYALVCRVVLGKPEVTRTYQSSKPIGGLHSRLAELGRAIKRFREFIIFDKDAIKIEYLVAYVHTKQYCQCGIPVRRRTKNENGVERPIITCENSYRGRNGGWEGGCKLFSKLPRCYCRNQYNGDFWGAVETMTGLQMQDRSLQVLL